MSAKNNQILDTTDGPILLPLIRFSVPIMLTNILQLLFNAADIITVGQFVNQTAVAAVGSTAVIISILVSLFTGLSVGATVVISTKIGKGSLDFSKTIHTTYTLGILLGFFTGIIGFFIAKPALQLLQTPDDIISQATLYLQIYFVGQPGFMIYTFARGILVAKGDTKSPFNYLLVSGIINIILNIILITAFNMGVAGVATATIVSQIISAILTTRKLILLDDEFHLNIKKLCLKKSEIVEIVRLGLPTGIQSTLFSISGLLVQSSVNFLGTDVVAGNSAANNISSFIAQSLNAFSQGCMTFAGQNYGAKKTERIKKIFKNTLLIDLALGLLSALIILTFGETLLGLYLPDSEAAIAAGMTNLTATMLFAFLFSFQDSSSFVLRGMNHSEFPMVVSVFANCIFRILWVIFVFNNAMPYLDTLTAYRCLLSSQPLSWIIAFSLNLIFYFRVLKKLGQS